MGGTGKSLAEKVTPYLKPIVKFITELSSDERSKLKSYFGTGAPVKVQLHFKEAIYKSFKDFQPPGLLQWIRESKGEFTRKAWTVGFEKIEPMIDRFTKHKLKEEFGEKNWWYEGVPEKVRKQCVAKKEEKRSEKDPSSFFTIVNYIEIIKENWAQLGEHYTPPGLERRNKNDKLKWLKHLNDIRIKYSHPPSDPVTEEEYNFLVDTHGWLMHKIVGGEI